jgi:para-aminobenzoate synthetase component 1
MKRLLVHELVPAPQPTDICASLSGLPYRIFFDSAGRPGKYARYSFVAADPVSVITAKGSSIEVRDSTGELQQRSTGNVLLEVRRLLSKLVPPPEPDLPPFQGGAAGYIGYEFGAGLEQVPAAGVDDLIIPDVCMGLYDSVFSWDHDSGRAWLVSRTDERMKFFLAKVEAIRTAAVARKPKSGERSQISSSLSRVAYVQAIQRIREYITAGDIFQANFAQRFRAYFDGDPWQLYLALRERNPAPFASFFHAGDVTVVSASPERFVRVDSNRSAETRPIKGTRPRMPSITEDSRVRQELSSSEKDNAEHVMIVDVLRNDLSRVCKTGSVQVTSLAEPEAHPTVHHLVSTIKGDLRTDCDAIDLLLGSLPGGSITGAPKIRAMQIIAELEPVRRDVYCGCMLYLTPSGEMDSSIVIRTFLVRDQTVFFSAGGGIVADSDPDMEFEETLHKAAALFAALEALR